MLRRVFSGIQPTGSLHLGNYLGAICNWVHLQHLTASTSNPLYCVVDLHALTSSMHKSHAKSNTHTLRDRCREMTATWLACGLSPEKSSMFVQSHVLSLIIAVKFIVYFYYYYGKQSCYLLLLL